MDHAFFLDIDRAGRMTLDGRPLPDAPADAVRALRSALDANPDTPWIFGGGMSLPHLYTQHPVARALHHAIRGFALAANEVGPAIERVIKTARSKSAAAGARRPGDGGAQMHELHKVHVHADLVNGHQVWAAAHDVQDGHAPRLWVNGRRTSLEYARDFVSIPASQLFLWKVDDGRYVMTARYAPDAPVMLLGYLARGPRGWEVKDAQSRPVEALAGLSLVGARDTLVWHYRSRFHTLDSKDFETVTTLPEEPSGSSPATVLRPE